MTTKAKGQDPSRADGETIDVYVDLRSPFSYIAKDGIRDLAGDLDVALVWHPYEIDIAAAYGSDGARDAREMRKVKYVYLDARRLAKPLGLVIRGPERIYDPTLAHTAMLFARRAGTLDRYLDLVYERFFLRQLDVEDRAAVLQTLAESGADPIAAAAYMAADGPDELAATARAAEADDVFGVPSFVYRGELFWGVDRLALLRERVAAGGRSDETRDAPVGASRGPFVQSRG